MYQISLHFVQNQYFRHDGQFSSFRQFFVKNEILWSLHIALVKARKNEWIRWSAELRVEACMSRSDKNGTEWKGRIEAEHKIVKVTVKCVTSGTNTTSRNNPINWCVGGCVRRGAIGFITIRARCSRRLVSSSVWWSVRCAQHNSCRASHRLLLYLRASKRMRP